ncbi:glycine/D-amino acid oxidase-like deaminating enzyme [Azospirillum fermentarium]|uniref:FAD-dependent oxidoreductase n=1 Tax=Azospirillum fermentarium TaxID=1233114 RepID=UPI0022269076|nr:FAD-dependent oxidoreductase [Azospirillum fermentarium]MCW2245622.1 glycine/D-amino acid oxidase-like deaminating enzyme [Azospirillum fermentarium]
MPVLTPPDRRETVTLPPRQAVKAARCRVLVVGGGPAGMGAAMGAAQAGADTILVERYGFLGGNATAALVMPWMSFYTQRGSATTVDPTRLMPQDHGPGEPVVGGALATILGRLYAIGGAVPPSPATGFTVPFDPEVLKPALQSVLDDMGVRVLLHAFASGITGDTGRPTGVVFETKSGPLVIEADTIIDATGDGDIAAFAGAPYDVGREEDGLVQPVTLMFRLMGMDHGAFNGYIRANPGQWKGVNGLWDLVSKATGAGDLTLPREDILFFATTHPGEVALNCTRVTGVLGTDVWDLTRAEWESHRQMAQIAAFMKKYVPGFADAHLCQSGVQVGVRETRRIRGAYTMTGDDVLDARKFPDAIARGTYPVDIHSPTGKGTRLDRLPSGEWYEIPLGCLLPQEVEGLLMAGRCISGTHEAHSSYRVTPTCMATGQAAGVAAALAAKAGERPRAVPVAAVQRELLRQGALLRPPMEEAAD